MRELISAWATNLGWKGYSNTNAKREKLQNDHNPIVFFQTDKSTSGGGKKTWQSYSTSKIFKVSSLRARSHPADPLTSRNLSKWRTSWGGAAHQANAPTESDCRSGLSSLFMSMFEKKKRLLNAEITRIHLQIIPRFYLRLGTQSFYWVTSRAIYVNL